MQGTGRHDTLQPLKLRVTNDLSSAAKLYNKTVKKVGLYSSVIYLLFHITEMVVLIQAAILIFFILAAK